MSYDVLQNVDRWLDVVLTAQSNGIDPVVDAVAGDLIVRYRKEAAVTSVLKIVAPGDWLNLDQGVYRLLFAAAELDTLGSFTYSVNLAGAYACVPFVPYYGHVEVGLGVLDNYQVGLGAHYDEDTTILIASLVLHKNGSPISSPVSSTLAVYDEDGTLLLTDISVTPDAQGVFRFEETVTLASKSIPYVSGIIVDSDGIHSTLTLTPVVG